MAKTMQNQHASGGRRRFGAAALLALLLSWLIAPGFAAADEAYSEDLVKAEFLSRFGEYIEWPAEHDADAALTIAVLASDDVAAELRRITAGRTVQGKPVRVQEVAKIEEAAGAHILYVGPGADDRLLRTVANRSRPAQLVVTDAQNGLAAGGMINFVLVNHRVRFEVSLPASEQSGLKLSSRLLGVALHVTR
jgi:hypothetical protein